MADRFARVRTQAKLHYDVNATLAPPKLTKPLDDLFGSSSNPGSRAGTPLGRRSATPNRTATPNRPGTPVNRDKITGLPKIGKRNMDDDVIASMDLGIEIDI